MRGFRYFENDLVSAVAHFADTQARNGRVFDYFTVQPEKVPCERENWCKYVRVPWRRMSSTDSSMQPFLPGNRQEMIHGSSPCSPVWNELEYAFSHPWRWDSDKQLVKRPYTIDSWDFAYSAGNHDWLQFQIDDNTFWGIMHGDNSGFYQACSRLATIYRHLEMDSQAAHWSSFAEGLKTRMNQVCWNGSFYTHFVKETPLEIEGVDENSQLSFSNPMNINRGVASIEQARSILSEYRNRLATTEAFAEWFSIDPPFPDGIFGDEKIVGGPIAMGASCRSWEGN